MPHNARIHKAVPDPVYDNIPGLLREDDGRARYAVDAAASYDSDGWSFSRYSHDREAAKAVADLLARRFGCVRLYEWGRRASPRSNYGYIESWIAFWWSDADYAGHRPEGSGFGIPEDAVRPIAYIPCHR